MKSMFFIPKRGKESNDKFYSFPFHFNLIIKTVFLLFSVFNLTSIAHGQSRVSSIDNYPHPNSGNNKGQSKIVARTMSASVSNSLMSADEFKSLYYDLNPIIFLNANGVVSEELDGKEAKVVELEVGQFNKVNSITKNLKEVELIIIKGDLKNARLKINKSFATIFPNLKVIVFNNSNVDTPMSSSDIEVLVDPAVWETFPNLNVIYNNLKRGG